MEYFQNALAYLATTVNYFRKKFCKISTCWDKDDLSDLITAFVTTHTIVVGRGGVGKFGRLFKLVDQIERKKHLANLFGAKCLIIIL